MFLILERPNDSVLSFEQWLLKSSGTFWLVSTCESFAFCFRTLLHVIQTFFLSSWEFVTTLDYEWRVIRGRLPYRWSIWVRNDWRLTLVSLVTGALERRADMHSTGLLRRARSLSCGCSIYRSSYERYEPHSLSGEYRVLTPTPFLGSDLPRFKFWISMITVGSLSPMRSHL